MIKVTETVKQSLDIPVADIRSLLDNAIQATADDVIGSGNAQTNEQALYLIAYALLMNGELRGKLASGASSLVVTGVIQFE